MIIDPNAVSEMDCFVFLGAKIVIFLKPSTFIN